MMESPFVTVSKIISEPVNGYDDLRIIANDTNRLDKATRHIIAECADELEMSMRSLLVVHVELIEAQRKIIALNEALLESRRALAKAQWSYNGPLVVTLGRE